MSDEISEMLWGTWDVTDVGTLLRRYYPRASEESITAVAEELTELHCSGMGYTIGDIEAALAGISG